MTASHELRTARCVVTEQIEVFDIVFETNAVALASMPPRRQTRAIRFEAGAIRLAPINACWQVDLKAAHVVKQEAC